MFPFEIFKSFAFIKRFLKLDNLELLIVDNDINSLLDKMKQYKPQEVPKWLKADRT